MSARKPPSGEFPNIDIPESVKRAAAAAKAYMEARELGVAELKPLSVNEVAPVPESIRRAAAAVLGVHGPAYGSPQSHPTALLQSVAAPPIWSPAQLRVSFSNIPHRKWLYGTYLIRGEITVVAAPGGAGKTALATGMAVEIATGIELLEEKIWGGPDLKVLFINAEDGGAEIARRVLAFCLAHANKIAAQSPDRLYVAGADDTQVQRLSFLRTTDKNFSILDQSGFDVLEAALGSLRPDLLILDPLVAFCAGGNMNDNAVMSLVIRELKRLAAKFDCAMLIVHHTRKGADVGNAEAISGAAATVNLARRAIMPVPMTEDEAKKFGVLPSERFRYFQGGRCEVQPCASLGRQSLVSAA